MFCRQTIEFFHFGIELQFVKLVKGKGDHQYNFTLLTNSSRPQALTAKTAGNFFWNHSYFLIID